MICVASIVADKLAIDLVVVKYSASINYYTALNLTKVSTRLFLSTKHALAVD